MYIYFLVYRTALNDSGKNLTVSQMNRELWKEIKVGIFTIKPGWIEMQGLQEIVSYDLRNDKASLDPYLGLPEAYQAILMRYPELAGRLMFSSLVYAGNIQRRGALQIAFQSIEEALRLRDGFKSVLSELVKHNKARFWGMGWGMQNEDETMMNNSVISFSACLVEKAWK
jgi:hypothetical protein